MSVERSGVLQAKTVLGAQKTNIVGHEYFLKVRFLTQGLLCGPRDDTKLPIVIASAVKQSRFGHLGNTS